MDKFKSKTFLIEFLIAGAFLYKFPTLTLLTSTLIISLHLKSIRSKNTSEKIPNKYMKAALYDPSGKGGLDFQISNIPIPKFTDNELLIQVKAAAINPVDYKIIIANMPFIRWFLPHTVGRDFSGIVVDIGKNIKNFKIGDQVYGNAFGGSLQEFTNVKENQIGKKADNLSFTEAASIGLAAGTSLQSLLFWGGSGESKSNEGDYLKNKKILIIGGSGGCGSLGIQIAKYYNAEVTATCSEKNVKFVQDCGADKVIDYSKPDFLNDLNGMEFDLIYDTVTSPEDINQEVIYRKFLKTGGKFVAINGAAKDWIRAFLFKAGLKVERKDYHLLLLDWKTEDLELMKKISEKGKLKSKYTVFHLDRLSVNEAFEKLKSRRTVGKLVFEI